MCGIAGVFAPGATSDADELTAVVRRMASTLRHRGPDDSGEWCDPAVGLALGFRRLAIMDLSPAGHQPMCSTSGRYVIAFNGEVYNFRDIRAELQASDASLQFRGGSDTEVMLAAIERWGLVGACERLIGMFAFALWDHRERRLSLVRDRLGVKPLYYCRQRGILLFGSELKALRAHPCFQGDIAPDSASLLMALGYIPGPRSIYKDVYKLQPGSVLTISADTLGSAVPSPYWSLGDVAGRAKDRHEYRTDRDAVEALDALLRTCVSSRMLADVPLGAFLSGGIDSSAVVALMQASSAQAVRTFCIGFEEERYSEAPHAKAVARHLGTEHTELIVTPVEAQRVIPDLPRIYDEPFGDSSEIPTYLVSALARDHVVVALSGDGGDEMFGGYIQLRQARRIWGALRLAAHPARQAAARWIDSGWCPLPRALVQRYPGAAHAKLAEILSANGPGVAMARQRTFWRMGDDPLGWVPPNGAMTGTEARNGASLSATDQMMCLDLATYLPDDIMVKVDRASMAVSLEAREPLLDHRLLDFALGLPDGLRFRRGVGKWLLRQVLYRYVPRELVDRPKSGFALPIGEWLRADLRDWAESLLDERALRECGLLDAAAVRRVWLDHLAGERDWSAYLWPPLMLQAWLVAESTSGG